VSTLRIYGLNSEVIGEHALESHELSSEVISEHALESHICGLNSEG
jgi:hypothetical protein